MLKFNASLIMVNDIARSRRFYEQLLGQKVKFDFGPNVSFEGFSVHLKSHFQSLLGDVADSRLLRKRTGASYILRQMSSSRSFNV